jgi:hypothetical protein
LLAVVMTGLAAIQANAQTLKALVFPLTGEIRLSNPSATAIPFVFYEIYYDDVPGLPAGGLNGADGVWKSIADTYDASGNGFVDPVNNWLELPATSKHLAEGLFVGSGSSLPGLRSITLGNIWNPSIVGAADLTVRVGQFDQQSATEIPVDLAFDGDYNQDEAVDEMDYDWWKGAFGSPFFADGNLDGIVNLADYTIWRDHLGLVVAGGSVEQLGAAGGVGLGARAVPEPTSVSLALVVGSAGLARFRRRGRRSG